MAGKRLSERADFGAALILSADYDSNPGVSGVCELGVRLRKTGIELWSWNDAWGGECIRKFPPTETWREIVAAALSDESIPSTVYLKDIQISGDRPPLGQLLALAWTDEEAARTAARFLLCLSDDTLVGLAAKRGGLHGEPLLSTLNEIAESANEHHVDIDDLDAPLDSPDVTLSSLRRVFRSAIASVSKRQRAAEADIAKRLSPFEEQIEQILGRWSQGRPTLRYPGTSAVHAIGSSQLHRYLREYVLLNAALPRGVHTIPAGKDVFGSDGKSFDVDFEAIIDEARSA